MRCNALGAFGCVCRMALGDVFRCVPDRVVKMPLGVVLVFSQQGSCGDGNHDPCSDLLPESLPHFFRDTEGFRGSRIGPVGGRSGFLRI